MEGKVAHMVDQPSKANRVRLFIRSVQPPYREHLRFIPFENFRTLKNAGMLVEEELA